MIATPTRTSRQPEVQPVTPKRHSRAARHHAERDAYSGFTLLEVVVALSLSVMLLAAVYGAIRLQYRLTEAGRDQMLQAQLSRAILQQIEADVRSIVWRIQEAPEESSESESGEPTEMDDDLIEITSTDDAFATGSSGVFGDSQNLVLHISRPPRALVAATSETDAAEASGKSDQASVSYFLADPSSGGLAGQVASMNGGDSSAFGGVVGLARLEGDRLLIEQAGANDSTDMLASQAKVLAAEVVSLEFAYWDGLEWLDSWDSVTSGSLPSAIGVTMGIDVTKSPEQRWLAERLQENGSGVVEEEIKPIEVRHVIAVPLAEPYVSEVTF